MAARSAGTASAATGSASWWAQQDTGAERRQRLDVTTIVAAATDVIDRDGLDGCTMAAVARELGTGAASLYRHVAARDELLQLVLDHVLGEVDTAWLSSTDEPWPTWVPRLARELRDTLLRHPNVVPLVGTGQMLGPNALRSREHATARLVAEGLHLRTATNAYLTVVHHVFGHVVVMAGGGRQTMVGRRAAHDVLALLPEDEYPTLRAVHGNHADVAPDDELAFSLDVLMAGLQEVVGRA